MRLLVAAAAAEDIDLGVCLTPLGLDVTQLARSDDPMSLAVWRSVMRSLEQMAPRPGLATRLGRRVPLLSHGPLAYLMASSVDLRQALDGLVRFAPLRLAVLNLRLRERGQQIELHVRARVSLGDVERFTLEFLLAMLCKSMRDLCGGACRAMKLHLPGSMARTTRVWAEQGVSVGKSAGWPYLSFPNSLAAMALPTASGPDRLLAWQACEEAERQQGWSASISSQIEQLFRTGPATNYKLEQIAEQLGVSRRTIARRLTEEHTSFSALVDASRKQRLLRRLADRRSNQVDRSLTLGEIAEDLGYADGAVLSRAVQRWFGVSPRDLQNVVAPGGGVAPRRTPREAEARCVGDLSATGSELRALGVVDLRSGSERGRLRLARHREPDLGLERLDGRIVEREVGLLGREVLGIGQAREAVGSGRPRQRAGVARQVRQAIGGQVGGRDDCRRVADEHAQPGAPLAGAFDLLHGAEADADLEAVALSRERVGGARTGGQRVAHQTLGDAAQVAARSPGPADRQSVDAYRRQADADGDRLAVLAAGADAFVELQIVADR